MISSRITSSVICRRKRECGRITRCARSGLWERLKRKDRAAVPGLIRKLKSDSQRHSYWWQFAPAVWCDELQQVLEDELSARSVSSPDISSKATETDYQISRVIMALPPSKAESLLLKHWEHLQFCDLFVQAALYFATPTLLGHVEHVVKNSPDPRAIFKHIDTSTCITAFEQKARQESRAEAGGGVESLFGLYG